MNPPERGPRPPRRRLRRGARNGALRSRRARRLAGVLLLLAGAGCTITPDQWGPLWSHGPGPAPGSHEGHLLWPLFRWREGPSERSFALRPLFERHDLADGSTRTDFLWPFGLATSSPRATRRELLPFFWWKTTPEDAGGFLAPLFFYSQRDGEPASVILFPLWGHWRNLLGIKTLRFLLFPLWMRTESESRTGARTTTTHVLWPILRSRTGEREGWALWPLWGEERGPGGRRSRFVLWPFFQSHHDEDAGIDEWFFFPFLGRSRSPNGEATTLLWPFFSWSHGSWGEAIDVWPFYKRLDHGDTHRLRWFPFYLETITPEIQSHTWLWPIFWRRHETTPGFERDSTWALPCYASFDTTRKGEPPTHATRVWPLIHWIEGPTGMRRVVILAPLPWSASRADESPWDFLWVLLRGWSWERDPRFAEGRSWFLEGPFRLFFIERNPEGSYLQLPLVRLRIGRGTRPAREGGA